jgi:FixJ family two-component response regulator
MVRVIVIDDDPGTVETFIRILRFAGCDATGVSTGLAGVRLARRVKPHLALVDLRLPDISGLDVVRHIGPTALGITCVVVTGFGDVPTAVEAMRAGASDFVQKPILDDELVKVVKKALERAQPPQDIQNLECAEAHSLHRWSNVVVRLIESPRDTRTLAEWGRFVGASTGTLRNWCRTARLSPRQSLYFARMLRAVVRGLETGSLPEHLLDVVDRRTLAKFLAASGCHSPQADRLPNLNQFFQHQRFIENLVALGEVRAALRSRSGG